MGRGGISKILLPLLIYNTISFLPSTKARTEPHYSRHPIALGGIFVL